MFIWRWEEWGVDKVSSVARFCMCRGVRLLRRLRRVLLSNRSSAKRLDRRRVRRVFETVRAVGNSSTVVKCSDLVGLARDVRSIFSRVEDNEGLARDG